MSPSQLERPATEHELGSLAETLAAVPGGVKRWKSACENALVMWCALSLAFVVVWWACAWLWRRTFNADYGLHSQAAPAIFGTMLPLFAIWSIVSTIRWARRWKNPSVALREDVEGGLVVEERHAFRAAKRFQEPEHGGLIYFLLATDGRTFAFYDRESQDLGLANRDPLLSPLKPMTGLSIVRGPKSGHVVSATFDGEVLNAGPSSHCRSLR